MLKDLFALACFDTMKRDGCEKGERMDTKELDAIVEATSSTSPTRKNKYRELWLAYVAEHGYDEAAENYLFDGYQLLAESTLAEYLSSCDQPLAAYQDVLRGARFQGTVIAQDTIKKLGLHLALLAGLLAQKKPDEQLLGAVAASTIRFSNKRGGMERLDQFPKMVNKFLVKPLRALEGQPVCSIRAFRMDDVLRKSFCKMIVESIPEEVARLDAPQFLRECKQLVGVDEAATEQEPDKHEKIIVRVAFAEPVVSVPDATKESVKEKMPTPAAEDEAIKLRNELAAQTKRADILAMKLEAAGKEREAATCKLEEADAKNAELQKDVAAARTCAESLHAELARKDEQIETLHAEIASRKEDYDRLEATLSKQQQASLNRLAQDLSIVYADFQDAQALEMSVDLGENLRDELADVFHTLGKYGLHFDA